MIEMLMDPLSLTDCKPSTSPSVYVVFSSLGATDLCGDVGSTVYNTTLSFGQHELSTSMGDDFSADFHPQTWLIGGPVTSFAWTAFDYVDLNQGYVKDSLSPLRNVLDIH